MGLLPTTSRSQAAVVVHSCGDGVAVAAVRCRKDPDAVPELLVLKARRRTVLRHPLVTMFTPTLRRCAAPGFWKKTADRIAQQTQFGECRPSSLVADAHM
jgi:hypothetical protein